MNWTSENQLLFLIDQTCNIHSLSEQSEPGGDTKMDVDDDKHVMVGLW